MVTSQSGGAFAVASVFAGRSKKVTVPIASRVRIITLASNSHSVTFQCGPSNTPWLDLHQTHLLMALVHGGREVRRSW
jgi:hypothetical protein